MRNAGPGLVLTNSALALLVCLLSVTAGGCGGQSLQMKKVDGFATSPSNVSIYFKASRPDGQAISLAAGDVSVYEDGKLLAPKKAKRAMLPPRHVVDRFVLVLVDMSGPLVDSEYLPSMFTSVDAFGGRMVKLARVGLAAFDGDAEPANFIGFKDPDPQSGLTNFRKFRPRTRNTDLWGAFVAGLKMLDDAARESKLPYQETTLVLVTDRTDKAGRHSRDEVLSRVQKSKANVYVIGIGDTINREELEPFGKSGFMYVAHPRDLDKPFLVFADRLEERLGQDYFFSYCSPKRKGKHDVELKISRGPWRGAVEHSFSAKGFAAGCDPKEPPPLNVEGQNDHGDHDSQDDKAGAGSDRRAERGARKKNADEDSAAPDES